MTTQAPTEQADTHLVTRRYDVLSATLDVRGPADWADTIYAGMLARCSPSDPKPSALSLQLRHGELHAPDPAATLLHDGPGQFGRMLAIHNLGPLTWRLRPSLASLRLDMASRTAELALSPDATRRDSFELAMHVMDLAIAASDQVLVHAACLADLQGRNHGLIFAPSGTGKTTTTLALAHAGHAMANDDAGVLQRCGDGTGVSAWGLARNPNVHRRTVAMLPWLAPMSDWSKLEERSVPLAKLSAVMSISPHIRKHVAAVFWLARGTGNTAKAVPLDPAEALARLLSDNVRHSVLGLDSRDLGALDMLTELLRTAPAYELQVPEGAAGLTSAIQVFGHTLDRSIESLSRTD